MASLCDGMEVVLITLQCMFFLSSAHFQQCDVMGKGAWHFARQIWVQVLTPPLTNYDCGQVTNSSSGNGSDNTNYLLTL